MINWMNYGKIQEYKRNGLKKSQAARRLGVDYKTILKYWDMSPAQYTEVEQASKKCILVFLFGLAPFVYERYAQ